jgi:hypothetical protein
MQHQLGKEFYFLFSRSLLEVSVIEEGHGSIKLTVIS